MRVAILALALAAVSSAAQAKITDFLCMSNDGQKHWAISTDDQSRSSSVSYNDGESVQHSAVFTPNDVRIPVAVGYLFVISRTTLRFYAGNSDEVTVRGACRIIAQGARKF